MVVFNVLVVDDEVGMRRGAERSLRNYCFVPENFDDEISFNILQAEDGASAIKMVQDNPVDIMLLDYKLPDTNGLTVLAQATEIRKDILTIMITAYASLEVAISATRKGVFDFLAKPFTPDELRITIKKAAEKIYLNNKARDLEQEKKKIRFQFISVLAHELKSPINAVENYMHLMKDRIAGDALTAYDDMIGRSLTRIHGMRRLISDILDLTRIESGQKVRELKEINLKDFGAYIAEEFKLEADKRGIVIHYSAPRDILFMADRGELEIVFNNIVSNAVKYNKDNGEIWLSIEEENGFVKICCRDSGIGMKEEDVKKLFREFVRIRNKQTENILGSGLGLAILKRIITQYNGDIRVESREGEGTTFFIEFPLVPQP